MVPCPTGGALPWAGDVAVALAELWTGALGFTGALGGISCPRRGRTLEQMPAGAQEAGAEREREIIRKEHQHTKWPRRRTIKPRGEVEKGGFPDDNVCGCINVRVQVLEHD